MVDAGGLVGSHAGDGTVAFVLAETTGSESAAVRACIAAARALRDAVGDIAASLFTPLRATAREEALGMDIVAHGEEACATGEGAILVDAEVEREREVVG